MEMVGDGPMFGLEVDSCLPDGTFTPKQCRYGGFVNNYYRLRPLFVLVYEYKNQRAIY